MPQQRSAPEALRMYIDGRWVEAVSGRTFEATNPATGQAFATLPEAGPEDVDAAVRAANAHQPRLGGLSTWERARLCRDIADVLERHKDALAARLSEDQGKPLHSEAPFEVSKAIEGFANAAEHVKWLESDYIPVEDPHKRVFNFRQPRGVYAVITPWNFPLNIPIEYLAPGIAAGNGIVWVPAPSTSAIAVSLMACLEEAGVPPGAVNLVTGPGAVVGDAAVTHPGTHAVGFTGSAATGDTIARRAGAKPLLLEMGGNGPVIVLDDADMDAATTATAAGCFANAGQVCSSSERVLVSERVYDAFAERMVDAARGVHLGDPTAEGTTMGPLNNREVAAKVARHVQDSRERGSAVVFGGNARPDLGGELYYEPTVLTDVRLESAINTEETFGPVVPLVRARSDDELLEIANRNTLGLVSSVFTRDLKRAFRFAEGIRTGIVNINDTSNYWELHIPFGGMSGKQSGVGRIGGRHTLEAMTDLKTVTIDLR